MYKPIVFLFCMLLLPCLLYTSEGPRIGVAVSFSGYEDFYQFVASPANYIVSAVYRSLMTTLQNETSNWTIVESKQMSFIPLSPLENRTAIEKWELDYLIKIDYYKLQHEKSRINLMALDTEGNLVTENKIVFYSEITPSIMANVYYATKDLISSIEKQQVKNWKVKQEETKATGYVSNNLAKIPEKQISNYIYLTGEFSKVEVYNLQIQETLVFEKGGKGYNEKSGELMIPLALGINIFNVSYDPFSECFLGDSLKKCFNGSMFKDDKIIIVDSSRITNEKLYIGEFQRSKTLDVYVLMDLDLLINESENTYNYVLGNFQLGIRQPIDIHSKFKFGVQIVNFFKTIDQDYIPPSMEIVLGYERNIGGIEGLFDYLFSWYIDGFYGDKAYGFEFGVNLRWLPVAAVKLGFYLSHLTVYTYDDFYYSDYYRDVYDTLQYGFSIGYEWFLPNQIKGKTIEYY